MTTQIRPLADLSRSAHARLKPVPLSAVRLNDPFWQPRRETNRKHTLKSQYENMESTGRIANFRRAAGLEEGEFEGIYFNDSDVYKWLEAAASTLAQNDDEEVREMLDKVAHDIIAAQQADGFLHTYYTLHPEKERWEHLYHQHQLYCMGHFIQAAVAHFGATGETKLLDVAIKAADCIDRDFGWGKREETDGHEEIELALVELYRATSEERYLKLAQFLIDVRGQGKIGGSEYYQDHQPFREMKRVTGHAVRALYYTSGVTDLFLETGEPALWAALEAQWANFTKRQMYVSGGAGSRWEGEAFGFDFELPNQRAYTETCAAIAAVMWAWRMGQHKGEARFFDVAERALYNGVPSGLSLGGDEYFYQNPLANDGTHRRQKWFGCACCPPNIARSLAQLPGYFYSVSQEGIWANFFGQNEAKIPLLDGGVVKLKQQTQYPWDGEISFEIESTPECEWSLFLRIPGWAKNATLKMGDKTFSLQSGEFFELKRVWSAGDTVTLHLPMETRFVRSHPNAMENTGRVAIMRGPLLYCAEGEDYPEIDLRCLEVSEHQVLGVKSRPELLGGIITLEGEGSLAVFDDEWNDQLYTTGPIEAEIQPVKVILIPYYAWANRGPKQMQVWLREG